jgi:hypothetical protein
MSMLDAFFSKGGGFRGAKWYALPPSPPLLSSLTLCGAAGSGDPEGVPGFVLTTDAVSAGNSKTLLKLTIPRIKLLRNRRELQLRQMRKDIAKLLDAGQEATARIRVRTGPSSLLPCWGICFG